MGGMQPDMLSELMNACDDLERGLERSSESAEVEDLRGAARTLAIYVKDKMSLPDRNLGALVTSSEMESIAAATEAVRGAASLRSSQVTKDNSAAFVQAARKIRLATLDLNRAYDNRLYRLSWSTWGLQGSMLRAGLTAKLPECSSNDPKRSRLPKIDLPVWTEAHLRAATNGVDRSLCIGGTRAPVFLGSVGHRLFAIKVADSPDQIEALTSEAAFLAHARHRLVVGLAGIVQGPRGLRAIVTPYYSGGNLANRFSPSSSSRYAPLDWRARTLLLYKTAYALQYLHACSPSLVHGALTPARVLLNSPGNVPSVRLSGGGSGVASADVHDDVAALGRIIVHVVTGGKVRGAASGAPLGATLAGVEADPATRWPLALAKGLFRLAAACGGGLARRPTAEKVALEIERLGKVAGIRVAVSDKSATNSQGNMTWVSPPPSVPPSLLSRPSPFAALLPATFFSALLLLVVAVLIARPSLSAPLVRPATHVLDSASSAWSSASAASVTLARAVVPTSVASRASAVVAAGSRALGSGAQRGYRMTAVAAIAAAAAAAFVLMPRKCRRVVVLEGHTGSIHAVDVSPHDADLVLSGSSDCTARVWRASTGDTLYTLSPHGAPVAAARFSPHDADLVVTGSYDGRIHFWSLATGECVRILEGPRKVVDSIDFDPFDASRMAAGFGDGAVRVYDVATGDRVHVLDGHGGHVTCVRYSPHERGVLATASHDSRVRVWRGDACSVLPGHFAEVESVRFSPANPDTVASGSADSGILLWDAKTGKCVREMGGVKERVYSVAFSPAKPTVLATGSEGRRLRLWDVETGKCIAAPGRTKGGTHTNGIAFSKDGATLVSGGDDRKVHVWRVTV